MSFVLLVIAGGFFVAGMVLLLSGVGLVVGQTTRQFSGTMAEREGRGRKRNVCFAMFLLFVCLFTLTQGVSLPTLVLLVICVATLVVTGCKTPFVRRKAVELSPWRR